MGLTVDRMVDAGSSASIVAERSRRKAARLRQGPGSPESSGQAERLDKYAAVWQRGADGEIFTARHLAWLPPGHVVVHDLQIPGSQANVDHLVVGPAGVVVLDTKASNGKVRISGGQVWRGRYPMTREFETMKWEAGRVSQVLGVPVHLFCCVVAPGCSDLDQEVDGIVVVSAERVCDRIRALPNVLNEQQITHVATLIRSQWRTAELKVNVRVQPAAARQSTNVLQRVLRRLGFGRLR